MPQQNRHFHNAGYAIRARRRSAYNAARWWINFESFAQLLMRQTHGHETCLAHRKACPEFTAHQRFAAAVRLIDAALCTIICLCIIICSMRIPASPSATLRMHMFLVLCGMILMLVPAAIGAQSPVGATTGAQAEADVQSQQPSNVIIPTRATGASLSLPDMIRAGGTIGYLIILLSLVMVALIADHVMNIRPSVLMPPGLAEEVHRCLTEQNIDAAKKLCDDHPSFLGRVLRAGLDETGVGYSAIEKAMEDAAVEQAARLFRRIEYLSVIGTLAPMLGLMGTVWGMIQAFLEFEQKANPQVSELAPGIYRALITTLLGLSVAVPSLGAFAIFRNRIDELAAESALLAEHVFADYRRQLQIRRRNRDPRSGD